MNISSINSVNNINNINNRKNKTSFKQGSVNILAMADSHGKLPTLPLLAETIRLNLGNMFPDRTASNVKNIMAIVGDWFSNGAMKGFITNPDMTLGDIQLDVLNKLIEYCSSLVGTKEDLPVLFTPGNHDYDGGGNRLLDALEKSGMISLFTNYNADDSSKLGELMKKSGNKFVKSYTCEIPDDKNPNLTHIVLNVGVTIPGMEFYNPGLLDNIGLLDNCGKKDVKIQERDISETIKAVKKVVDEFKEANPKGAVILHSHTGLPLSEILQKRIPGIDVILNGHDHQNCVTSENGTSIYSLGQDNELLDAITLRFDDEGNLYKVDATPYFTATTNTKDLDINPIALYVKRIFADDTIPITRMTKADGSSAILPYEESIRYANSDLANFLTSAIKKEAAEISKNPDVIVGLPSSIVRGGIKDGSTNMELMDIFKGVSESLSGLNQGNISGKELAGLIIENIKDNLKAPKRNTILQWSDVLVDRTLLQEILEGRSTKKAEDAIKIRTSENRGEFVPIDLEKVYTMVINDKFLLKNDIEWPAKIRDRFVPLTYEKNGDRCTYNSCFRDFLRENNFNLGLSVETYENRVV